MRFLTKSLRFVKAIFRYFKLKCKECVKAIYQILLPYLFEFKFLIGKYDYRQFNPLNMKKNLAIIGALQSNEWINSTSSGELSVINAAKQRRWQIHNFLTFGALQKRTEKVIFLSYLTFLLEINNPFDKEKLNILIQKKLEVVTKSLKKIKKINGRLYDTYLIEKEMKNYEKNSILQLKIVKNIQKAARGPSKLSSIEDAKMGIKKGLYPVLISHGCSGAYWMRSPKREIVGLFKPFDEEIHAPNNPIGPRFQGALGARKTRIGVRVGECCHREVAAFLVDQFLGFGIVPHTAYASFAHYLFFDAHENLYGFKKTKIKYGSFQEYVVGFKAIVDAEDKEINQVAIDEYQLLIVLDIIIGNSDRNAGNFLINEEKIAAIDHGLSFPDRHENYSKWYWEQFPHNEIPMLTTIVNLIENFPIEQLGRKLKRHCYISQPALARMKERIILFREGLRANLTTPKDLATLMTPENLYKLTDLDSTLATQAEQIAKASIKPL